MYSAQCPQVTNIYPRLELASLHMAPHIICHQVYSYCSYILPLFPQKPLLIVNFSPNTFNQVLFSPLYSFRRAYPIVLLRLLHFVFYCLSLYLLSPPKSKFPVPQSYLSIFFVVHISLTLKVKRSLSVCTYVLAFLNISALISSSFTILHI